MVGGAGVAATRGRRAAAGRLSLAGARERSLAASPYECLGCGAVYALQYHVCPECGGFSVESRTDRLLDAFEDVGADRAAGGT